MFDRISAVLPASDMERARAFYEGTLGLEVAEVTPQGSVEYRVGDTSVLLYPSEFAGTNSATAAGFEVSDIDAVAAELKSRGIEFQSFDYGDAATESGILEMPDGTRGAWFVDPEGNILGMIERG